MDRKLINKTISLRKKFTSRLRKFTNYKYDRACSIAFNGEGFYVNHVSKVNDIKPIWGYDKHWAYGGALLNNKFPLSCELTNKETELGLFYCKLTNYEKVYKDFDYTLYRNMLHWDPDLKIYFLLLTNLDYEIFTGMYKSDIIVYHKKWFKDIGYMSDEMKDYVRESYIEKKKYPEFKTTYETVFYGMNAKTLLRTHWKNINEEAEYLKAYAQTDYKWVRKAETPIAMFQTAYLRYEEYKNFLKYKDNVVYMNTDSIYFDRDIKFENLPDIGKYGLEYDGMPIQFIRRNAYVVLNKDMKSIYKTVIGSIVEKDEVIDCPITMEDLEKLKNMESVIKKSYKSKEHTKENVIDFTLSPNFKLDYYDIVE